VRRLLPVYPDQQTFAVPGRHVSKVPTSDIAASFDRLVDKPTAIISLLPDASLPQPIENVVELPTKLRIA
jgi:hypothetical protein